MGKFRTVLGLLTLTTIAVAPVAADDDAPGKKVSELWHIVSIDGQPAGYTVEIEYHNGDRIISDNRTVFSLSRFGMPIQVDTSGRFVETTDGKPVSAIGRIRMGPQDTRHDVTFGADATTIKITSGGRVRTQTQPAYDGSWLPPAASMRRLVKAIEAGEQRYASKGFNVMTSIEAYDITRVIEGREDIEVAGKTVPAIRAVETSSLLPNIKATIYYDEHGRALRSTANLGMFSLLTERADEALARVQRPAPELLASTMVTPDKPIAKPRELTAATYRLSTINGKLPDVIATPVQSFQREADNAGVLTIALNRPHEPAAEAPTLTHSTAIDGRDPLIVAATTRALAGAGADKAARAEALRRFVHGYIDEKNLGVGFATASDVVRTKTGDCTEHAVLLAAMLRADGVPSRVASGLIYVDRFQSARQVFGYHMWTQAWIGGRWVDLDAVLGDGSAFDATHITLSTSAMPDGTAYNSMIEMLPLFGNLKIEVLEAE